MQIERRIRGAVCLTVHPHGCEELVQEQIRFVLSPRMEKGPRKVLIIGASTGYGLATRIAAAFGARAETVGVFFERPADEDRTAAEVAQCPVRQRGEVLRRPALGQPARTDADRQPRPRH